MASIIFGSTELGKTFQESKMTKDWLQVKVIAHRCGGAMAPENSLAGLAAAARHGVHSVEFDVMLSADGEPFLIHDEMLERTTDGFGPVAATPAAMLRLLVCGKSWPAEFASEPIPTLECALERCHALGFLPNIEIKPAAGFEEKTGAVVAAWADRIWQSLGGGREALLLSSFSVPALEAARLAAPLLRQAWLIDAVPECWLAEARRLDVVAIHCSVAIALSGWLNEALATGLAVRVYTVNEVAQARQLFSRGVSAVFSDRYDKLSVVV